MQVWKLEGVKTLEIQYGHDKKSSLTISRHYDDILKNLFHVLQKEHNGRVLDNICAAVCRMIMANILAMPMDQVRGKCFRISYTVTL
jgi:uncharacterized protein (DUF927 family)